MNEYAVHVTNMCNLNVKLLPVMVDPTTVDSPSVDTIQANNIGGCEERG